MKTIQTAWVVITGGPSSGKTTTVNHLQSLGFATVPEAARTLIDNELKQGKTIAEIRGDEAAFNRQLLPIQQTQEGAIDPHKLYFFDRGIPDIVAYARSAGDDATYAVTAASMRRYKAVFLLELLPFEKDYARTEDEAVARYIEQLIYQAYTELNYSVQRVPRMSIAERSAFIIETLGLNKEK